MSIVDSALDLAKRGFAVHPLRGGTKLPASKNGFKDATTDPEVIRKTFKPGMNLGIACGKVSGIAVLDIDPKNDGDKTFAALCQKYGEPPFTVRVNTPSGGTHIYFKYPERGIETDHKNLHGIEIQSDGTYVVAPPSHLTKSAQYKFEGPYTWDADGWLAGLAPADWLLEVVRNLPKTSDKPKATNINGPQGSVERGRKYISRVPPAVQDERGDENTFKVAAYLVRNLGLSDEQSLELMREWNATCSPPWDEDDLRRKITNARKYGTHIPEITADIPVKVLAEVEPRSIRWLWDQRVPYGKVTVLQGERKRGKGWVYLTMSCAVSLGTRIVGNAAPIKQGNVLLFAMEDALDDTIRPRLEAMGADLTRICAYDNTDLAGVYLPGDVQRIEELIQRHSAALVVFDTLADFTDAKLNLNNNQHVRQTLGPLRVIAERTGAAVLVVNHVKKGEGDALMRGLGSVGVGGLARSVLHLDRHPDDKKKRVLAVAGSNVGGDDESSLVFQIGRGPDGKPVPMWEAEAADISADDLATADRHRQEGHKGKPGPPAVIKSEAVEFLRLQLKDGPMLANGLVELGVSNGLSRSSIHRARESMNLAITSKEGRSYWSLPDRATNLERETFRQPINNNIYITSQVPSQPDHLETTSHVSRLNTYQRNIDDLRSILGEETEES